MMAKKQRDPWASIKEELRLLETAENSEAAEPAERIPCPDESCVGTLGEDGFCRLCGASSAKVPVVSLSDSAQQQEQQLPMPEPQEDEDLEEGERVCCSDESCVGTVDEKGYCRICGLKWKEGGYCDGETLIYKEESA